MACAPSEDSDQPGHPPDQSFRCPHEESLGPYLPIERTVEDSDQTVICDIKKSGLFCDIKKIYFVILKNRFCDITKFIF